MPLPMTTKTIVTVAAVTMVLSAIPENNSHTITVAAATMVVELKEQTEAPADILLTTITSQQEIY
eukprot:scaffold421792_cov118-Attheya_sp.AAC.1